MCNMCNNGLWIGTHRSSEGSILTSFLVIDLISISSKHLKMTKIHPRKRGFWPLQSPFCNHSVTEALTRVNGSGAKEDYCVMQHVACNNRKDQRGDSQNRLCVPTHSHFSGCHFWTQSGRSATPILRSQKWSWVPIHTPKCTCCVITQYCIIISRFRGCCGMQSLRNGNDYVGVLESYRTWQGFDPLLILFGPFLDLETPLLVPIHDPLLVGILLHTIPMIPKGNDEGLVMQSDSVTKWSK